MGMQTIFQYTVTANAWKICGKEFILIYKLYAMLLISVKFGIHWKTTVTKYITIEFQRVINRDGY